MCVIKDTRIFREMNEYGLIIRTTYVNTVTGQKRVVSHFDNRQLEEMSECRLNDKEEN